MTLRFVFFVFLLLPLTIIHATEDLPEPPTNWSYPPEMPGPRVEVYRQIGDLKLGNRSSLHCSGPTRRGEIDFTRHAGGFRSSGAVKSITMEVR